MLVDFVLIGAVLIFCFGIYIYLRQMSVKGKILNEFTENIIVNNKIIHFDTLNLKQKIAQMIIARGDLEDNAVMGLMNLGGIFLDKQKSEESYKNLIRNYQDKSHIELFTVTDMEGDINPFKRFRQFKKFSEIETRGEAYNEGFEHGKLLKKLGFNLNFSPAAEIVDECYGGRAFLGTKWEIKEKLKGYIKGLQKNVQGVCKHYPGKGMIRNLYFIKDKEEITGDDLDLFNTCFSNSIGGVMVGHQMVHGAVDSLGKPACVSKQVVMGIEKHGRFDGLIVSDEINMLGLKSFYFFNKRKLYKDLINSGMNVILDFRLTPVSLYKLIEDLVEDVKHGKIHRENIDNSVRKILVAKGYRLK